MTVDDVTANNGPDWPADGFVPRIAAPAERQDAIERGAPSTDEENAFSASIMFHRLPVSSVDFSVSARWLKRWATFGSATDANSSRPAGNVEFGAIYSISYRSDARSSGWS